MAAVTTIDERLQNLRQQHRQLSGAEEQLRAQLRAVRARRLKVEGALELAESIAAERDPAKPANDGAGA
jgi:prefoldin subunit 5